MNRGRSTVFSQSFSGPFEESLSEIVHPSSLFVKVRDWSLITGRGGATKREGGGT